MEKDKKKEKDKGIPVEPGVEGEPAVPSGPPEPGGAEEEIPSTPAEEAQEGGPILRTQPLQRWPNGPTLCGAISSKPTAMGDDLGSYLQQYVSNKTLTYAAPSGPGSGHTISMQDGSRMTFTGTPDNFQIKPEGPTGVDEAIKFLKDLCEKDSSYRITITSGTPETRWDAVQKVIGEGLPFSEEFDINRYSEMEGFSEAKKNYDSTYPAKAATRAQDLS